MSNGKEDQNWSKKWIVGKIMDCLVTHKHQAKKYIYDWTPFFVTIQENQQDCAHHNTFM